MRDLLKWFGLFCLFLVASDVKYFSAETKNIVDVKFPRGTESTAIHLQWKELDGLNVSFGKSLNNESEGYKS